MDDKVRRLQLENEEAAPTLEVRQMIIKRRYALAATSFRAGSPARRLTERAFEAMQ